jgi:hypothetical protein
VNYFKTLDEVLDRISKVYVDGCVAYWSKAEPNTWQQALDSLEDALLTKNERLINQQLIWFESTIKMHINKYKEFKKKTDPVYRMEEHKQRIEAFKEKMQDRQMSISYGSAK